MKYKLSKFFKSRTCVYSTTLQCDKHNKRMTLAEYSKSKSVKTARISDSNRSICAMLRNINGETKFKYHDTITILVNFTNNAVIHLGQYSKNPGNRWGGRKTRSDFNEDKKNQAIEILNHPHHTVFVELKKLYTSIKDKNALHHLLEIVYYLERINSKILEYENKIK